MGRRPRAAKGAAEPLKGFSTRLRSLVEAEGSQAKLAESAGISPAWLSELLKGGEPSVPVLVALAKAGQVSVQWLATGQQAPVPARLDDSKSGDLGARDFAFIPRLEVEASAGGGSLAANEDTDDVLAFRRDWLRRTGVNPNSARVLRARGDSMEPTIRDGDILLVDASIDRVIDEGIYVVVLAGLVLVKRLEVKRDGTVILKSDNGARYGEERIPKDETADLAVVGRVMWFGRAI